VTFSGVQTENGTYLVGGHLGRNQRVNAAGTRIIYHHRRNRTRDKITIAGPTNALLRVTVSMFSPYLYFLQILLFNSEN